MERFRLRFQSLLARGLASSEIAARVGIAAASEVWGGAAPRERPAWYVWLRGVAGAWQVELAGAEALPGAVPLVAGRFTLRHYPSPAAPEFGCLSPEERRWAGEAFDGTGTPRIDATVPPEAFFTIATLDWALQLDGDGAAFAVSTLDRLRARSASGEIVRDVPGWRFAVPVFSAIAGLHAQVERRAATRLVLTRQPGFELVASEDRLEHREDRAAVQADAVLLFPGGGPASDGSALLDALLDPGAELAADAAFLPGSHPPHALGGDPRIAIHVSTAWFGGEQHVEDLVACTC